MLVNLVVPLKFTFLSFEQPLKAPSLMDFTVLGIVISVILAPLYEKGFQSDSFTDAVEKAYF